MSEEIKDIILDVKDSLNETPKKMYKYNKITFNLNELSEILKYVEQLEKENEKLNSVLETLKETNSLLINQKYKLEYELDTLDNKYEQLENIRKEAIELINKNSQYPTYYLTGNIVKDLLNILNKGDNK